MSSNDQELRDQFGSETANLIRSLNRLDNKDWLPPLLLCLRQSSDGLREDVPEVVFKLERLAYFLFMVRADLNARMSPYADVLDTLEPLAIPKPRTVRKERSTGMDITRHEAFALFVALNGPVYLSTRVVKPILPRLEQASTDASAFYDYPTISVEHVCPQTLPEASEWAKWYSDPDDHSTWLHRIGNLVLLNSRKNSAARNFDFDTKKSTYFAKGDTCAFSLTSEVRDCKSWKPKRVGKRQVELLERLANDWQLEEVIEDWWESQ